MATTIKIDGEVWEAAGHRAKKTRHTLFAYTEDLILQDIKKNSPEIYKNYKAGKIFDTTPSTNKTAMEKWRSRHFMIRHVTFRRYERYAKNHGESILRYADTLLNLGLEAVRNKERNQLI